MKKLHIFIISSVLLAAAGCNYLDIVPDNVATIDHAFTDRTTAERYLSEIYFFLPYFGEFSRDPGIGASDEFGVIHDGQQEDAFYCFNHAVQLGLQSTSSPYWDFWSGKNYGRGSFVIIRECDTFLDNIGKVKAGMDEETRERWIAEVKFIKAFYHFYLMRLYGPIPVIRHSMDVSAGVDEVRVFRDPVQDVVAYIVELCNEAMEALPETITDPINEMGRVTKPAAAMLKAEALVWLASPLFNGNPDYADFVDKRGVRLFPDEDNSRWADAAKACKDAIDIAEAAGIKLFVFNDNRYSLSEETTRLMSIRGAVTERWNEEIIFGKMNYNSTSWQRHMVPCMAEIELQASGCPLPDIFPSFKTVEAFYTNHGVPMDEDVTYDYENRYKTTVVGNDHYYYIPEGKTTAILNTYREPRFYASLGFDTGYWWGNGHTKEIGSGTGSDAPLSLAVKSKELSGKQSGIRYSVTGYYAKKLLNFESACGSDGKFTVKTYSWPIMRLADLYLLYAEALNESKDAPDASVYEYIDRVRERAGLNGVVESWKNYSRFPEKPSTKDGMRDIIRHERLAELSMEGQRFYDLRRWRMAMTECNKVQLAWSTDQTATEDYYVPVVMEQPVFSLKDYFWPIAESELLKNTNLIQNPGWE